MEHNVILVFAHNGETYKAIINKGKIQLFYRYIPIEFTWKIVTDIYPQNIASIVKTKLIELNNLPL